MTIPVVINLSTHDQYLHIHTSCSIEWYPADESGTSALNLISGLGEPIAHIFGAITSTDDELDSYQLPN